MKTQTLSQHGLDLLKQLENFSATVYPDAKNVPTIGYGHALKKGEFYPHGITQSAAEALLRADCNTAERCINAYAAGKGSLSGGFSVTQCQFDALVLFAFNVGISGFSTSTLRRCLQSGDKDGAAEQFMVWNKITVDGKKQVCNGLTHRRQREQDLFLGKG